MKKFLFFISFVLFLIPFGVKANEINVHCVSEKINNSLEKWYRKGMPFLIVQRANYQGWRFVQSISLHRNFCKQWKMLEYWGLEPWKQHAANGTIQRNCHFSLVLFISHCVSSVLPFPFSSRQTSCKAKEKRVGD